MEMDKSVCVLERANDIMEEAVEKAGELLTMKPRVAEVILKQLLKCDPEHLSGLQLLGLCKHRLGEHAEAIEIISTALELDPDNADNYNNLGLAYAGLGNHERSIAAIEKAIEHKPDQFLFKNNLALQYRAIGNYEKAVQTLQEAIESEPRPQLYLNLGGIYGEMKDVKNAELCFQKALEIDPEYPAAHVDLAFAYHLQGKWKEGFAEYEWRFWYYPQMNYYREAYDPEKWWDGNASLEGKRVLIYGEQGLGDIIQFVRYVPELKKRGAHVIIHCPMSLDALVKTIEGVDETCNRDIVNNQGPELPEYDYHFSIMSFPFLLKSETISGAPYIKAVTTKFREYIREEYGDCFKVGILWAGSPAHPHDRKRSIPLKHFKVLQEVPNVKLFSLQMDTRPRQYGVTYRNIMDKNPLVSDPLSDTFQKQDNVVDYCEGCEDMSLVDFKNMIQSFEDTAVILEGLDLVICCDTAVAHLAGAMGKPVWICIPYNPDWRWLLEGETTAWYDSMRIFRQRERDNWQEVFERVGKELHETVLQNQR